MRNFTWYIIGLVVGIIIAFAVSAEVYKTTTICKDQLKECQTQLDDPHHCISVLVDFLEGNNDY